MSDNDGKIVRAFKVTSIDPTEERLKNMQEMLGLALQHVNESKPSGLMIIYQDERDEQYFFKYDSVGLKNSEKISLLEFVKMHVYGAN